MDTTCVETDWLDDDERVIDAVCSMRKRTLVLTTTSLIVVDHDDASNDATEGVTLVQHRSKTDLLAIIRPGFVAWAHSERDAYILTRDGKLTIIPLEEMGETVDTYAVAGDVRSARMIYFDGRLFVGPVSAKIWILRVFGTTGDWSQIPLPRDAAGRSEFQVRGRVLFFADQSVAIRSAAPARP